MQISSLLLRRIFHKICLCGYLGLFGSSTQKTFADPALFTGGDIAFTLINLDAPDSFTFVSLLENPFFAK